MSEKVLAFDLSTTESGWALGVDGKLVEYGTIKPSTTLTPIEKLIYTIDEAVRLIRIHSPVDIAIEDIYLQWAGAYKILGRLQGAMIVKWWEMKFRAPYIYSTTSARKNIGIKGNAQKKDVMKAINRKLGLKIKNDNISDAIVLLMNYYKEQADGQQSQKFTK